jgi:hypothetical protein
MNEQRKTRKDIETHIIPQAWKDDAYKQELLSNAKTVIEREFGVQLPDELNVHVMEEDSTNLYFVLPARPNLSNAELSEDQLEAIAGGNTFDFVAQTYTELKDFGGEIYKAVT